MKHFFAYMQDLGGGQAASELIDLSLKIANLIVPLLQYSTLHSYKFMSRPEASLLASEEHMAYKL